MALYTIGDLHLSGGVDKPMGIFGAKWENHDRKLCESFSALSDEDVTVICGDISWGMNFEECLDDFALIDSLPGKKIILKGNHDYWWATSKKINEFLNSNGFGSISILHNNSYLYSESGKQYAICGTRGWFFEAETGSDHDGLILAREVGRLRASLASAPEGIEKLVFLHYPPVYANYRCDEILEVLKEYNVRRCRYGHIHGKGLPYAFNGWLGGTEFRLVSADFLNFTPEKINLY